MYDAGSRVYRNEPEGAVCHGYFVEEGTIALKQAQEREIASLTACVAYILGIDSSEVPGDGGVALSQWLAGRNLGLVSVDSPQSFQWPGRFIGLRADTSSWAVFFGAPPGVLFDPVEESKGKENVGLKAAYVLAEQDPLREVGIEDLKKSARSS